jgi:AraC family transcriptional regulator
MDLRYEGVERNIPPPAGSIALIPAGSAALWRWRGSKDSLHIYLDPRLIARVAAASFELDSARMVVPPLDGLIMPALRAAMFAVDAELTAGGVGGPLMIESLANVLAVHLIRHFMGPRRLFGPKSVLLSLQADRRRHAGTVSDFRKNRLKERKLPQDIGRRVP